MKRKTLMMQVYLLRHGVAEEERAGSSDAGRALTADGRRKLRQVLGLAAESRMELRLILSSPFKRALQTAQIAQEALGYKGEILLTNALTPGADPEDVWSEVRVHASAQSLLLVGHNPLFANLAAYLLGTPNAQIDFKKGAIMRIDFESVSRAPQGVLRWYLTARLATPKEKGGAPSRK